MKQKLISLIEGIIGKDLPIELSVPEESSFGHYSTSVAMRLAKMQKRKPMELAEEFAARIRKDAPVGFFEKIEAAAPGFVNFWLSKETVQKEFGKIFGDDMYGTGDEKKGKAVIVEFTDPNPFKEFHIGHLMSNSIGESIARLIEAQGAAVKRLSYGGDIGLHVAKAIYGVLEKKTEVSAVRQASEKEQLSFWASAYVSGSASYEADEAAKEKIDALNKIIFDKSDDALNELYDWGREISIKAFKKMFARLGTDFSKNYWESEVVLDGMKAVETGLSRGILEKSEGAIVFKGESYGLHTRVFVNSRGIPTYEAKELGLTLRKHADFDFDSSIVITGNEQDDYFKVLLKVIDLLTPEIAGKTVHIGHGMLRFSSGKMSSRKGNVITAESLFDQVKAKLSERVNNRPDDLSAEEREVATEAIAVGAVKYSILKQSPGQDIVFDFDKSLSVEGDSGPYVQYAYARLKSILRKANQESGIMNKEFVELNSEPELVLMRKIFEFPDVVARAGTSLSASGLAAYVHKLAVAANKFYETTPILSAKGGSASGGKDENAVRRDARLALVGVAARTLKAGLELLGIRTLEKI
jgi:arginyl-tRNA synthetase